MYIQDAFRQGGKEQGLLQALPGHHFFFVFFMYQLQLLDGPIKTVGQTYFFYLNFKLVGVFKNFAHFRIPYMEDF